MSKKNFFKQPTLRSSLELDVDLKLITQDTTMQAGDVRRMDVSCLIPHEHYQAVEVASYPHHRSTPIKRIGRFTIYLRRDGTLWLHMKPMCLQPLPRH